MPKLTVRFLIDGNQVDEVEVEESNEKDLRYFVDALKHDHCECVSNLHDDADIDYVEAFKKLQQAGDPRQTVRRRGTSPPPSAKEATVKELLASVSVAKTKRTAGFIVGVKLVA